MTPEASPRQSGQNVTVGDDCGHDQRQTAAAWQRGQNLVRLRLKLAASLVALISGFGLALASDTPQSSPSPLEQGTVGPLHLGMTVQQVLSILGPAGLREGHDHDWSDTSLRYTDGAYDVWITFERPYSKRNDFKGRYEGQTFGIWMGPHERDEAPLPYIRKSLTPIVSWKWLGKHFAHQPRDRHTIGFLYHYHPSSDALDWHGGEPVSVLFLESRYVDVCFEAWSGPEYTMNLEAVHRIRKPSRETHGDEDG